MKIHLNAKFKFTSFKFQFKLIYFKIKISNQNQISYLKYTLDTYVNFNLPKQGAVNNQINLNLSLSLI